jgi:hypothetical protein
LIWSLNIEVVWSLKVLVPWNSIHLIDDQITEITASDPKLIVSQEIRKKMHLFIESFPSVCCVDAIRPVFHSAEDLRISAHLRTTFSEVLNRSHFMTTLSLCREFRNGILRTQISLQWIFWHQARVGSRVLVDSA